MVRIARRRLLPGALSAALASLALLCAIAGVSDAPAYLLPAALLLAVLGARRYPGERKLLALVARVHRAARGRAPKPSPRKPSNRALMPRGGRLLATSLAVRPPPRAAALPR